MKTLLFAALIFITMAAPLWAGNIYWGAGIFYPAKGPETFCNAQNVNGTTLGYEIPFGTNRMIGIEASKQSFVKGDQIIDDAEYMVVLKRFYTDYLYTSGGIGIVTLDGLHVGVKYSIGTRLAFNPCFKVYAELGGVYAHEAYKGRSLSYMPIKIGAIMGLW